MKIELGKRVSARGLVLAAGFVSACGTQPITIGDSESAEGEPVAEQRQALGTTAHYLLSDGNSSFAIKSLEGGAVKAPVITTTVGVNGTVNKFLGPRKIEPVTVPVSVSAPTSYVDWARAALNKQFNTKDFQLSQCDVNLKEVLTRSFDSSVLSGLSFGPFDAAAPATNLPLFKTTFVPERSTTHAGSGAACKQQLGGKQKSFTGNFAVEIDGIDATGVTKIEEFALTRVVPECTGKEICAGGGSLVIPTLRLSIVEGRADSWLTWFDDFVVSGNDSETKERSGEITLLGADMKTELLKIGLSGIGIARFTNHTSDVPGNEIPDNQWVADLYVEGVTLTKPAVK